MAVFSRVKPAPQTRDAVRKSASLNITKGSEHDFEDTGIGAYRVLSELQQLQLAHVIREFADSERTFCAIS
jgi:hypothetical protein